MKNILTQYDNLPAGGFMGGEALESLPAGGFHGGEALESLPSGGFHA